MAHEQAAVTAQGAKPERYDAWYDTPRGRWVGDTLYGRVRSLLDLQRATARSMWAVARAGSPGVWPVTAHRWQGSTAMPRPWGSRADTVSRSTTYVYGEATAPPFVEAMQP